MQVQKCSLQFDLFLNNIRLLVLYLVNMYNVTRYMSTNELITFIVEKRVNDYTQN